MQYDAEFRLPFLRSESLQDAEGSQGVVARVLVEKGFLKDSDGYANNKPREMACKQFRARTPAGSPDFEAERATLDTFKKLTRSCGRIMQSFASFTHGSDFMILSPWANGRDLYCFLTNPAEILNNYVERSARFTPHNLLRESCNLASALNFLHREMKVLGGERTLRCAHLDLKPENILVFFPLNDRANEAPVGIWKISDFGLSKVEEEVAYGKVVPVDLEDQNASVAPGNVARELSVQVPTRGPGAYQPPEVQTDGPAKVSTKRDVWSYGCVLAMVLAFALKGPEGVEQQTRGRCTVKDDCFYENVDGAPASAASIKEGLMNWLGNAYHLAGPQHREWIGWTSELVISLLDPNVTTRPEIPVAIKVLGHIIQLTERQADMRMWAIDDHMVPSIMQINHPSERPPPTIFATPNVHQRARRDSRRSSGGSGPHSDPARPSIALEPPTRGFGAIIEPSGNAAALWSSTSIKPYDLSPLHTDPGVWSSHSKSTTEPKPLALDPIDFPDTVKCMKVQLAGKWMAVLIRSAPTSFCIHLYFRSGPQQAFYQHHQKLDVQAPDCFELSSMGTLVLKYRDRLDIRTLAGKAQLTMKIQFAGMAFTRTGGYFCLWERDQRDNHWTVWSQEAESATSLTTIGNTISQPLPEYSLGQGSGAVLLAPFSECARFIACDRQQHVYVIRADLQDGRAHVLDRTDNAVAMSTLDDYDESFVLLRKSQHGPQTAEKCWVLSAGVPSFQASPSSKLQSNVNLESDGVAVVRSNGFGEPSCLLILKPFGLLVRQAL